MKVIIDTLAHKHNSPLHIILIPSLLVFWARTHDILHATHYTSAKVGKVNALNLIIRNSFVHGQVRITRKSLTGRLLTYSLVLIIREHTCIVDIGVSFSHLQPFGSTLPMGHTNLRCVDLQQRHALDECKKLFTYITNIIKIWHWSSLPMKNSCLLKYFIIMLKRY